MDRREGRRERQRRLLALTSMAKSWRCACEEMARSGLVAQQDLSRSDVQHVHLLLASLAVDLRRQVASGMLRHSGLLNKCGGCFTLNQARHGTVLQRLFVAPVATDLFVEPLRASAAFFPRTRLSEDNKRLAGSADRDPYVREEVR
eukprot:424031-Hanusia_phi.AAC.2